MTTVRFLAIGDLHIRFENFRDIDLLLEIIIKIIDENEYDFVVLLGDVLDKFINIKSTEQNKAYEFIEKISENVTTYVLVGNHDMINNQQFLTNNHSLYGVRYMRNVYLAETVISHIIKEKRFTFTPYVYPSHFLEALNLCPEWIESVAIFAHQEFYGSVYDSDTSSVKGDKWLEENPLVISGHIHGWSMLQNNIIYTGAPMQHKFDETGDKFIWDFTIDGENQVTYDQITIGLSEKRTIRLTVEDAKTLSIDSDDRFKRQNTKFKAIVTGSSDEIKIYKESDEFLELSKFCNGKIITHVDDTKIYEDASILLKRERKNFFDYLRELSDKNDECVQKTIETVEKQMKDVIIQR